MMRQIRYNVLDSLLFMNEGLFHQKINSSGSCTWLENRIGSVSVVVFICSQLKLPIYLQIFCSLALAYFVYIGGMTLQKYCYITSLSFKFMSYLTFFSGIAKLMRCLCYNEYDILKVSKTTEVFVQIAFKLSVKVTIWVSKWSINFLLNFRTLLYEWLQTCKSICHLFQSNRLYQEPNLQWIVIYLWYPRATG